MNQLLRDSVAHVFVASLDVLELDDTDQHHLARVVRLRDGESVTASDGAGLWRACRWAGAGLVPDGDVQHETEEPRVHLFSAIPKGDRVDWLVQKATEVGVADIHFVDLDRSVVRWDGARRVKQLERLNRIAREAAAQSRRVWCPSITGVSSLEEAASSHPLVLAEPGGRPVLEAVGVSHIVVGPEGGFSDRELALVTERVSLGRNILRVETACVVAVTLMGGR